MRAANTLCRKGLRVSQTTLTYLVEVEGEVPCHRAVEARLEKGRPAVAEAMWSSTVVLAHSGHSGVDCLQTTHPSHFKKVATLCASMLYKHTACKQHIHHISKKLLYFVPVCYTNTLPANNRSIIVQESWYILTSEIYEYTACKQQIHHSSRKFLYSVPVKYTDTLPANNRSIIVQESWYILTSEIYEYTACKQQIHHSSRKLLCSVPVKYTNTLPANNRSIIVHASSYILCQ